MPYKGIFGDVHFAGFYAVYTFHKYWAEDDDGDFWEKSDGKWKGLVFSLQFDILRVNNYDLSYIDGDQSQLISLFGSIMHIVSADISQCGEGASPWLHFWILH